MIPTIVILGAGATKSCGGALTREILSGMLQNKDDPSTKERLIRVASSRTSSRSRDVELLSRKCHTNRSELRQIANKK